MTFVVIKIHSIMSSRRYPHGGGVHGNVDDCAIIGTSVNVTDEHQVAIQSTEHLKKKKGLCENTGIELNTYTNFGL